MAKDFCQLIGWFFHNPVTGSWLGFPNPRYMCRGLYLQELAETLMAYMYVLVSACIGLFLVSGFASDAWEVPLLWASVFSGVAGFASALAVIVVARRAERE